MNRTRLCCVLLSIVSLSLLPGGCPPRPNDNQNQNENDNDDGGGGAGGGGNGNANDNGNDNDNANENDNGNGDGNTNTNDNTNGNDNGNDNGGDPDFRCEEDDTDPEGCGFTFDLSGYWIDHAATDRQVLITHEGATVFAQYVDDPYVCEHGDEEGTTSETTVDFEGTLSGCLLTGEINTCVFGCQPEDDCTNGITPAPFRAAVATTGDHISGCWESIFGDFVDLSFDRLPCRQKTPDEYGLPEDIEWTRTDDEAQGAATYTGTETTDRTGFFVMPGVSGTVRNILIVDESLVQVVVTVANGNIIAFDLYGNPALMPSVEEGDQVTPSTELGLVSVLEDGTYRVTVIGETEGGERSRPDCVEEPSEP